MNTVADEATGTVETGLRHCFGGRYAAASTAETIAIRNAAGRVIAKLPRSTPQGAEAAFRAARTTFDEGPSGPRSANGRPPSTPEIKAVRYDA